VVCGGGAAGGVVSGGVGHYLCEECVPLLAHYVHVHSSLR
jgi:hypothetical protein